MLESLNNVTFCQKLNHLDGQTGGGLLSQPDCTTVKWYITSDECLDPSQDKYTPKFLFLFFARKLISPLKPDMIS